MSDSAASPAGKYPVEKNYYKTVDGISLLVLASFSMLMVTIAVIGAIRSYSPIPFWDMWDGYIGFFERVSEGDASAWWSQHNEHRIVLARILFWLDLKFFRGTGIVLIVANYLLVGASALLFWSILKEVTNTARHQKACAVLGLFLTEWLFLWSQENNFTWGFQSQFILAQLVPLCALYWLHRSLGDHQQRNFVIACGFGIAAAGTMANGVLALPLMIVYAIVTRQRVARIVFLAFLGLLTLSLYFYDYHAVAGHGSFANSLTANPIGFLTYIFTYLGSPYFHVSEHINKFEHGQALALVAGMLFCAATAVFAIRLMRKPVKQTLSLALLFFIAYIVATAAATAGGRLLFGVDQALSSRYTTPAIMAWAALFILAAPYILNFRHASVRSLASIAIALTFVMLPLQIDALHHRYNDIFQRKLTGLALTFLIEDKDQLKSVYPSIPALMDTAKKASTQNISFYSIEPYLTARRQFNNIVEVKRLAKCDGSLDMSTPFEGDERFLAVRGWIFNRTNGKSPSSLRFLNHSGKVVGYAFTGEERGDVAKAIDRRASNAGYRGYLESSQTGETLLIQGIENTGPICEFDAVAQFVPFHVTEKPVADDAGLVTTAAIMQGNQWLGSDFENSTIKGFKIFGSRLHSDSDTGTVSVKLKRGDKIFYRSGPTSGHQMFEIIGSAIPPIELPRSINWMQLDFFHPQLPDGEFIGKFSDDGASWGEWSAIAVKSESAHLNTVSP